MWRRLRPPSRWLSLRPGRRFSGRGGRHDTLCNNFMFSLANLIPSEVRFFDHFEQQSQNIIRATGLLHELIHPFADPRPKAHAIKAAEQGCDQITHEIVRRLNTTGVTPIAGKDIHDPAPRYTAFL